jgi:N utilization substance protein B
MTINTTKNKRKKKPLNNRRKARELVMKSIYRGLINNFDLNQIKKDIKDDPDFLLSDETLFLKLLNGVYEDFELLKG